jgi:hypothetical protein
VHFKFIGEKQEKLIEKKKEKCFLWPKIIKKYAYRDTWKFFHTEIRVEYKMCLTV